MLESCVCFVRLACGCTEVARKDASCVLIETKVSPCICSGQNVMCMRNATLIRAVPSLRQRKLHASVYFLDGTKAGVLVSTKRSSS